MIERHPRLAFWLVPERSVRQRLQEVIDGLADRFTAPPFTPHVTLASCLRSPGDQELASVVGLLQSSSPLSLECTEVQTQGQLTRTLAISFAQDAGVSRLVERVREVLPAAYPPPFDPHLSLLYQTLPETVRHDLVDEMHGLLRINKIRFDTLYAVAIPRTLAELDQFRGWQTQAIINFGD